MSKWISAEDLGANIGRMYWPSLRSECANYTWRDAMNDRVCALIAAYGDEMFERGKIQGRYAREADKVEDNL